MTRHYFRPTRVAAAAALAAAGLWPAGAAFAQSAQAAPAAEAASAPAAEQADKGLNLDQVVVTGTSRAASKMRSSVSISTLGSEAITNSNAVSAAEVLRSIPGLRSESSGGESNANVGVRGLPISAGGARYIQFQEDGLPVLQFGDIAFATADSWLRVDGTLDRLEVVRGGSASTLATGSPGGIINYLSKTGLEEGGSMSLTKGLDFDQTRYEFGYGGRAGAKTRFYVGGFHRVGDGGRPGAEDVENGGQIRANITHELSNNGFVRLSFKHLDDHTPTFLPTPVRYTANGDIEEIPGIDPRRAAFYNAGWPVDLTLTNTNGKAASNIQDGLSAKSDAIGAEFDVDAGGGLRIANKFRWAKNSGQFIGIFPGNDVAAAPAGTTIATGAGAGGAYTGDWFQAVVFNTKVHDVGLVANDLRLSKTFDLGGDMRLTGTGGLYTSTQNLKLTWNFNQYALSASGENARLLNVSGFTNGAPGFGGCCMNFQDSKYTTTAPYIIAALDTGPLSADISIRHDKNSAKGVYYQTLAGTPGTTYNLAEPQIIDYDFGRTSYSLGVNFRVTNDLAVFARYSDGAAYLADRITFFNSPGLVNGTTPTVPRNEVSQFEGGVKWRYEGLSLFATLFAAQTDEINVDLTTTPIQVTRTKYDSKGLELEAGYRIGGFSINGGMTITDAKVKESTNAAIVGKTPKRQAKVVYQLTPAYSVADFTVGASIVGTTKSKDDGTAGPVTITLPAFVAVNAFANYQITDNAMVALGVNNLFDTIGYTESNDGRGAARSINGRTVKATLKYSF
jgi:catecholate siderophore receptor